MSQRPKRLGKGLDALLGDAGRSALAQDGGNREVGGHAGSRAVPIESLAPSPFQPRRQFDPDALESLAESMRAQGVVQPLLVRPVAGDRYQIIAGERRWRAAQLAKLHDLPVVVRDLDDRAALEIAIIENVQRADLTPLEEAQGYQRLIEEFGDTQEAVATRTGKSRSHVANSLRLLALPKPVQAMLDDGKLRAGHARALLGAPDPEAAARHVVARGLTVRQTEALVRGGPRRSRSATRARADSRKTADIRALEADLSDSLGLRVIVDPDAGSAERGALRVHYESLEQLDDVIRRLKGSRV